MVLYGFWSKINVSYGKRSISRVAARHSSRVKPSLASGNAAFPIGNHGFAYNIVDIKSAATGCMVRSYLKEARENPLTKEICDGIYTAVMTDTGSFCYSNTNEKCHEIAIESLAAGVNTSKIYQTVYENRSPAQVELLAGILNNLDYDENGELAWFIIDQAMMDNANAVKKDVDGFTDFVRTIRGVEVALMVFENGNETYRINFRSKGKYVINGIAKSMGGGGHKFAAGAITTGTLAEVLPKVLSKTRASLAEQNGANS
mgnify:CR=1 FL=1